MANLPRTTEHDVAADVEPQEVVKSAGGYSKGDTEIVDVESFLEDEIGEDGHPIEGNANGNG